jgi:hypothetical protein
MQQSQGTTQGTYVAPSRETMTQRFSSLFGSSSSSSSSPATGTDPTSALESPPASGPMASFRWVLWALLFIVVVWLIYLIMKTVHINDIFTKFLGSLPLPVQKWFAALSPQQQDKIKTEVVKKKQEEGGGGGSGSIALATGGGGGGGPPAADDSISSIQTSNMGKAGWCFIGEERGIRTCAKVQETDTCMSGNIFPSQDICVNPTLRP